MVYHPCVDGLHDALAPGAKLLELREAADAPVLAGGKLAAYRLLLAFLRRVKRLLQ